MTLVCLSPPPLLMAFAMPVARFVTSFPLAGMPSVTLSDFSVQRLELISLFLMGLVASAFVVQRVWNGLNVEFPSLPKLSYRKAFSFVFLWGLLFVIVLTMISGARELMTPGAWVKKGNTYSLAEGKEENPNAAPVPETHLSERKQKLTALSERLTQNQQEHNSLPLSREELMWSDEDWHVPHAFGLQYVYFPELLQSERSKLWLVEPEYFSDGRLGLWNDGRIVLFEANDPVLAGGGE